MLRIKISSFRSNQEGRDPLHKFINMKKEVILKASEMLKSIENLEGILESLSGVASLEFRNEKDYSLMSVELRSRGRQSVYLMNSPAISPLLESIIQETAEKTLSLFRMRIQSEKKRLEASLEAFNEEDFYRSQLFTKIGEGK